MMKEYNDAAVKHWLALSGDERKEHLKMFQMRAPSHYTDQQVTNMAIEEVWADAGVGASDDKLETRRIYSVTIDEYNEAIDGESRRFYRVDVNGPIGYAFKQSKNFDDLAGAYKYAKRVTGAWYDLSP